MTKHRYETDAIKIVKESEIKKANKYSYKTIIPKEVMDLFPQLKEHGKIEFRIIQTDFKEYDCDIILRAKGLKICDVQESNIENEKESSSNIDDDIQKPVKTKTTKNNERSDAGNTYQPSDKYANCPIYQNPNLKEHYIRYNDSTQYHQIEIVRKSDDKREKYIGATNRTDKEKQQIIKELTECESYDASIEILEKYRNK